MFLEKLSKSCSILSGEIRLEHRRYPDPSVNNPTERLIVNRVKYYDGGQWGLHH